MGWLTEAEFNYWVDVYGGRYDKPRTAQPTKPRPVSIGEIVRLVDKVNQRAAITMRPLVEADRQLTARIRRFQSAVRAHSEKRSGRRTAAASR